MHDMVKILVMHGPNLGGLGRREPAIYGSTTLAELNARLTQWGRARNAVIDTMQSDDEGAMVAAVQSAVGQGYHAIVLNPAGLTHTSVALRDAVAASAIPILEVHISNVAAREPFRSHSLIAPVAAGSISGLGVLGYEVALDAACQLIAARCTTTQHAAASNI